MFVNERWPWQGAADDETISAMLNLMELRGAAPADDASQAEEKTLAASAVAEVPDN